MQRFRLKLGELIIRRLIINKMNDISDNKPITVDFSDIEMARQLFGEHNANLQRIAEATESTVNARGSTVFIQGDSIAGRLAQNVLEQLYGLIKEGYPVHPNDIDYAVRVLSGNDRTDLKKIFLDTVFITSKKNNHCTQKSGAEGIY